MLAEALHHWLTPAPKWIKTMGYVREQVALDFRHRRRHDAWAPHLDHCKTLIRSAVKACPDTRHCVVLGSGHLLDIPLNHLAATFERVDLVDITHPRAVRRRASSLDNVHLVTADISGASQALHDLGEAPDPSNAPLPAKPQISGVCGALADGQDNPLDWRPPPLPQPKPDAALIADAGLVISANLLSQLPILLLERLESRCPWIDDEVRMSFARAIIDHHLALLQNHDGQICLISEVMRLVHDHDQPIEKVDPLFGTSLPYEGEEWWWDIAPRPELGPDFDVKLRVLGLADLANAPQARYCRNTTLAAP
jgi:hypothetical protein